MRVIRKSLLGVMAAVVIVAALISAASPVAASVRHWPPVVNGSASQLPIVGIHGHIALNGGVRADQFWSPATQVLNGNGWTGTVAGVMYYSSDSFGAIDARVGTVNSNTPIETIALNIAQALAARYGSSPFNVVAHSMGGAAVVYALGHEGAGGFPVLNVAHVVTLSTPFGGADVVPPSSWNSVLGCGLDAECREMTPGSAFLADLASHPLPAGVVLSTEGGGPKDNVDSFASSTRPDAAAAVDYYATAPVNYAHTTYPQDTSTALDEPYRLNGVAYVGAHSLNLAACQMGVCPP